MASRTQQLVMPTLLLLLLLLAQPPKLYQHGGQQPASHIIPARPYLPVFPRANWDTDALLLLFGGNPMIRIRCSLVKPQKTHAQTFLLTLAHLYFPPPLTVITSHHRKSKTLQDKIVFDQIPHVVCWLCGCYWILVNSCLTGMPLLLVVPNPGNLSHKIHY